MKRGFWRLFGDSMSEYGEKFLSISKTFLLLYVLPLVIVGSLVLLLFSGIYSSIGKSVLESGSFDIVQLIKNQVVSLFSLIVFMVVFGIILGILYFWTNIAYTYIGLENKKLSFSNIFKFTRKNFWRYVGLTFLVVICLIPLYILFIVPGIIFTVFWAFSGYILLKENTGIRKSMKKSRALVKGRWWHVFGYGLLFMVIFCVASFVLGLIPFFGNLISYLVLTPLLVIFFKNFYLDLKDNPNKK